MIKYTLEFETSERLTEDEENELRRTRISRRRMTNKSLVDYCNGTPTTHCEAGCPYESRECEHFYEKYKSIPYLCDEVHPEYYTDDVISEGGEESNGKMLLDELFDELVKIRDSSGGDTEVYFRSMRRCGVLRR